MAVKVIFTYDEEIRKWQPTVKGAVSGLEATQAFNAVVVTLSVDPLVLELTVAQASADGYEITPCVGGR